MDANKRLTRRDFLRTVAIGSTGAFLAACVVPTPETVVETVVVEKAPAPAPVTFTYLDMISTIWGSYGPQLEKFRKDFDEMHPEADVDIDVRILVADANWEATLISSVNAGTVEDVFPAVTWLVAAMVDKVPLHPLDNIIEEAGGEEMFTALAPWKGHQYHVGFWGAPQIAWANQTWLDEDGVDYPTTWDEYISIGQAVTHAENSEYANTLMLGAKGGGHIVWAEFLPWLAQAGGQGADEQNRLTINTPEGAAVLEFWKEQEDAGILTPGSLTNHGNFGLEMYGSGNQAWIQFEGAHMPAHFRAQQVPFEVQGKLVPEGPGGRIAQSFPHGLAANANAEHLDYVVDWINFHTTGEANREFVLEHTLVSAYKPILEQTIDQIPEAQPMMEQAEIGWVPMPVLEAWFALTEIMSKRIGEFWVGEKTAKQALDDAAGDWKVAVERV
jgi:ABC-type glycerol-3-phosphate transport system substrate-binding protein